MKPTTTPRPAGPPARDPRPTTGGGGPRGVLREIGRRARSGELGSAPVVVGLLVIWLVFQLLDRDFLSPRNLSNLGVDSAGTGLIAVGLVFVLLVGDIDLSVASVSGLAGAVFAVLNVHHGLPEALAMVAAVLCGAATGVVHGFFVARCGVPAFVVTLAGLLGWTGLMFYIMGASGTINLDKDGLVAGLTSHYFSHPLVPFGLAAAGVAGYFAVARHDLRRREAAGVPGRSAGEIAVRTAVLAGLLFVPALALARFQGMPLALLLFLLTVTALDLVLRRTAYGRKVFAVGGGVEAARRAGVNVEWVRMSVFVVAGVMSAVGGLFLASRVTSVSQAAGTDDLLINVIAAAVIGGTSLFGGRGRTWSALLGVLVIQSIASGMALLGIQAAVQFMITGGVLLAAVVLDTFSRRLQRAHGRA